MTKINNHTSSFPAAPQPSQRAVADFFGVSSRDAKEES